MTTTAAKQTIILRISSGIIGSLSKQLAIIEVKNGLVYQTTMTRARGANGAAKVNKRKFAWPVKHLIVSVSFLFFGNSLIGL